MKNGWRTRQPWTTTTIPRMPSRIQCSTGERGQSLSYTPERLLVAAADRLVGGHAAGARLERLTMDPIALLTSAVLATMVSVLLFALPGIALGPLVMRTASSPLSWAGRAAGVSLLAVLIECTVLATLGLLSAASVVAVTIGVSVRRLPRAAAAPAVPGRSRPAARVVRGRGDRDGHRARAHRHPVASWRASGPAAAQLDELVLPPPGPGDGRSRRVPRHDRGVGRSPPVPDRLPAGDRAYGCRPPAPAR